jgi:hypothetical protein
VDPPLLSGQQAPKVATAPQSDPRVAASTMSTRSDGCGSTTTVNEVMVATVDAVAKKAAEVVTAKEATVAKATEEAAKVAAAKQAAEMKVAEEATAAKVVEETVVAKTSREATSTMVAEEAAVVKVAAEAVAVAGPDSSSGGGPGAVRTNARPKGGG